MFEMKMAEDALQESTEVISILLGAISDWTPETEKRAKSSLNRNRALLRAMKEVRTRINE